MPAVVRVKRRIDEEPLSAFVLNGKRRRLEDENEEASPVSSTNELSTLLKFAGTINELDDTATTQYARLTKEEAKELVLQKSQKPQNVTDRTRQELRQHQQEQRFRVVNCLRTTVEEDNNSNDKSNEVTIVDIEKHSTNDKTADNSEISSTLPSSHKMDTTNLSEASTSAAAAAATTAAALTLPTDSDTGYVYDLYIPDNGQQVDYVDLMDDNYLSVAPFDEPFGGGNMYVHYEDYEEYDSEDSNDENYFTNDYPDEEREVALHHDEDSDYSDNEDEGTRILRKGLAKFMFDDGEEENDCDNSSSDDNATYNKYQDPYVHTIDLEQEDYYDDVDRCTLHRHSMKRYLCNMDNVLKITDSDDDEVDSEEEEEKEEDENDDEIEEE